MTRAMTKPDRAPRGGTADEVAEFLRHSPNWFREKRAALEAAGFPKMDALLGRWDMKAVALWWDQRSGLCKPAEVDWSEEAERRIESMFGGSAH